MMNPPYLFQAAQLLPEQWSKRSPQADVPHIYNPSIVRFRDRLLMAYRVDFGYEKPFRVACAICELDQQLQVIPGSVVALSDTIQAGGANHYDPRFLVYQERLFIHYNNDWNTIPNQIFLVELDPDTLQARAAARPLHLEGQRQPCEKNWMLFEHDGDLFAIYQIVPHIVLRLELSAAGPVRCQPVYRSEWDATVYTRRYGLLRGGTPPVRLGQNYISVFHSRTLPVRLMPSGISPAHQQQRPIQWARQMIRWLRERLNPVRYYGGIYSFAATPPFAPTFIQPHPLLRPELETKRQRPTASHMAPRRVVYPCGLVPLDDGNWLVSFGVHDEYSALRVFSQQKLLGEKHKVLIESQT